MQVWDIAVFHTDENNKPFFSFEFNNIKYVVTAEIMKKALHLPKHGTITPTKLTNDELLDFLKTLGYASDATKIGSLQRSLGKKEWNFFFDNISRCLLNKVSNFDALPSGSLQIGYSLIHNTLFDHCTFLLELLAVRKEDKTGFICYIRFLKLIFNHFCPNSLFDNDELLPIYKIADTGINALMNGDRKTSFKSQCDIPDMVRHLLQTRLPNQYGLATCGAFP